MNARPLRNIVLWGLAMACNAADDASPQGAASTQPVTAAGPGAAPPVPRTVVPGLPNPLKTDVADLVLVDRVDVANEANENAHEYAVQDPTFIGVQEFDVAATNVAYTEDGRAMKTSEAFKIKVVPNRENLLIRAFDTLAKEQKVRVLLDGRVAGEWELPDNDSSRYGEAVFPITASMVGDRRSVNVKLEYISGIPDINSFVYWVYSKPDGALSAPLKTKVSGLTLTDQIDIANEADESEHQYLIDKSTYIGTQELESPVTGLSFLENGRAYKSFESFHMKVTPNKDHILVKAYDTISKNQVVRVLVNGAAVGDWSLPDGEKRYGEGSFRIPARVIGSQSNVTVRIEFLSGTLDANSFRYWLFADAVTRNG